ncbi:MAG: cation-translocating P-type ATPase [Chrysiogenia bacterium]
MFARKTIVAKKKQSRLDWHSLSAEDIARQLATPVEAGLDSREAARRQAMYGPNQIAALPRPTFLQLLLAQFNNFIVLLLIAAASISGLLGEWIEAVAILAIVVLNATLGVIQDRRAEEALAALKKLAAPEAQVLRDGSRRAIPSPEIVPGDIVFIEAGNFVPADLRLVEAVNLRLEEAALTGESVPVQKDANIRLEANVPLGDRRNTAFMGTLVNSGRGRGIVVSTGMHTQIGLIAEMLQNVKEETTPLQKRLDGLGKVLGGAALAVCALVFAIGWMRGHAPLEMFMLAVGLAIAAVPEGLPAVVTISLALGMREMVKRHALIRRLSSVETLGSTTVICSDKTGTLTQNKMTVTRMWADGKFLDVSGSDHALKGDFLAQGQPVQLTDFQAILTALWVGALNNDAHLEVSGESSVAGMSYRMVGDPTEGALLVAAAKAGALPRPLNQAYPRVAEIPFDSTRKNMVTVHHILHPHPEDISPFDEQKLYSGYVIAVKGAPDMVLNLCSRYQCHDDSSASLDDARRRQILEANETMTRGALRVLGLAYRVERELPDVSDIRNIEKDLVFVGLTGMIDPPRPEAAPALAQAGQAGIRTIMITGDFPNTARAIADSIGLLRAGRQVLTGKDIDALSDAELEASVNNTDVFARVSPENKLRIVNALRANSEVVAMTGDGVNDAPSIKAADIGVAMGITGTDVAKESADMVLTDDNYASIVSAVEQGRIIYDNIRKFVFYLLSSNVAEIMIIFLAMLAGLPSPLTVIQLLWLNLITDGAPALALAMEKGDPDIMRRQPRPPREPVINANMRLGILIQTFTQTGAVLTAFALGLLWHLRAGDVIPPGANPMAFLLRYDWRGLDVQNAETMAFMTLSLCELFRAYTVRSERISLFRLGIFSNRYMQAAVALSFTLLLLVVSVPFLQPVFNTHLPSLRELWVVLGLALVPAMAEELTKLYLRHRDRK